MEISRKPDGTLLVPVEHRAVDSDGAVDAEPVIDTKLIHPGEGGYDEALAEWDRQQNPDADVPVSTATGREEAMHVVHEVAESPEHEVQPAIDELDDPEAAAEALRHVLIGGVHSVEDFAKEVADAEGGEPLRAHEATKIIGEVLAVLD
jgi:hypothetical protein